jgi:hypothetical protein
MSKIQEKLDSLQPYIVGIRYIQGLQVVDAVFKEGWTIPSSDVINKEMVDESQNYYMFFTEKEGITVDDLLDYVEGIININIEREKKHELLKSKVKELQKIFKDNPLTKLERLKFSFGEPDIVPSLLEMDIDLDDDAATDAVTDAQNEPVKLEPIEPEKIVETNIKIRNDSNNNEGSTANINGQKIELPPKGKIELEEHEAPVNIRCKCGPDDVCPVCEEEKIGSY